MSDYERYGDYNSSPDEDPCPYPKPRWHRILSKAFYILLMALLLGIVLIIGLRLIIASYYPPDMKRLTVTDPIAAYLASSDSPQAYTQELRVPYESRSDGFYHVDNLIFVPASGSLQLTVRVNTRAFSKIAAKYGTTVPDTPTDMLSFSLFYTTADMESEDPLAPDETEIVRTPTSVQVKTKFMYTYIKLCFEDVDLGDTVPWYRLNIHVSGATDTERQPTASVPVYENHSEYSYFDPYKFRKEELTR